MKKAIILAAAMLLSLSAWGQLTVKDAISVIRGKHTVSCTYSYDMKGDFPLKGSGTAVLSGHMYHTVENGLETFSDGHTVWAVDSNAKEVVVSKAGEAIVSHLEDFVGCVKVFHFDGESLNCSLVSEEKGLDLDFTATGIKTSAAPTDSSQFCFDTTKLDSSWIVTDLR